MLTKGETVEKGSLITSYDYLLVTGKMQIDSSNPLLSSVARYINNSRLKKNVEFKKLKNGSIGIICTRSIEQGEELFLIYQRKTFEGEI